MAPPLLCKLQGIMKEDNSFSSQLQPPPFVLKSYLTPYPKLLPTMELHL